MMEEAHPEWVHPTSARALEHVADAEFNHSCGSWHKVTSGYRPVHGGLVGLQVFSTSSVSQRNFLGLILLPRSSG